MRAVRVAVRAPRPGRKSIVQEAVTDPVGPEFMAEALRRAAVSI